MTKQDAGHSVAALIGINIVSSVLLVSLNKYLVETYHFRFILLLTSLHFLAGWAFLRVASSPWMRLFAPAASAPSMVILRLAIAGAGSIALLNYSLRLNSVGTYQIMKVAVLPATMALSYAQRIAQPSMWEVAAAGVVAVGTLLCTMSDVWVTFNGLLIGAAGVASTAQYQIWQGTVQRECNLSSTQVLYLMSLPQAWMTLVASLFLETDWTRVQGSIRSHFGREALPGGGAGAPPVVEDLWTHAYQPTELVGIVCTCVAACFLNYSTIGVIGKTSAVTMQFVAQVKTVLIIVMGMALFPKSVPPADKMFRYAFGLGLVFVGVAWYTRLKHAPALGPSPRAPV